MLLFMVALPDNTVDDWDRWLLSDTGVTVELVQRSGLCADGVLTCGILSDDGAPTVGNADVNNGLPKAADCAANCLYAKLSVADMAAAAAGENHGLNAVVLLLLGSG